jgi:hypothetical protein
MRAAGDWLYEEGFDASTATFKEKLDALNKTAQPIFNRYNEAKQRPAAINSMLESLNYTHHFLARVKQLPEVSIHCAHTHVGALVVMNVMSVSCTLVNAATPPCLHASCVILACYIGINSGSPLLLATLFRMTLGTQLKKSKT